MTPFSENALEQAAMTVFEGLGYEAMGCLYEVVGDGSTLGRKSLR